MARARKRGSGPWRTARTLREKREWPGVDSLRLIADEFGVTIDVLVSDEDVERKRAVEDQRSLRYYWAAMACALGAMALGNGVSAMGE